VTLAVIAMVSIAHVDCGQSDKKADAPSTVAVPASDSAAGAAVGELVIEDNSLASWIAINNTFALPDLALRDPSKAYYWAGLLVQVGDFPSSSPPFPRTFKRVVLSKGGNVVREIVRDPAKMFWINIVSRPDSTQVDPMAPQNAVALYPSAYAAGLCPAPGVDPNCLRGQKIHSQMNPVLGILTYWQGPNGYGLTAKQPVMGKPSSFEFKLLDDFKVEIYDITGGTPANPISHNFGDIDKITISATASGAAIVGPSDGDKQDPPWPGK
jgi:hypothetical protein